MPAPVQAPAATFAPPLDTPMRVTSETTRTDRGVRRRFSSAKRVTFRRAGDGFRAELVIEPGGTDASDGGQAAMLAAGMARLAGRKLVFDLDARGRVTGMPDLAGSWQALLDGFAVLLPPNPSAVQVARLRTVQSALAQLPAERRLAILASMVTTLIAADLVAERAGAPQAVRVPASSAFGTAQLDGLRVVRRAAGAIEVEVSATGPIAITTSTVRATGSVTLETVRRIDPHTGLLRSSSEVVRTVLPDGSLESERISLTRVER